MHILNTTNPFMKEAWSLADSCPEGTCQTRLAKHQEFCELCHKATNLNVTPAENRDFPTLVNQLTYAQYDALFPVPPGSGRFLSFACLVSAQGEIEDYSQVLAWTPRPEPTYRRFEILDDDEVSSKCEEIIFHECESATESRSLTGSELREARSNDLEQDLNNFPRAYGAEPIEDLDITNLCAEPDQEGDKGSGEALDANPRADPSMASFLPLLTVAVCLQVCVGFSEATRDLDVVDIFLFLAAGAIILLTLLDLEAVVRKFPRAKASICNQCLPTDSTSNQSIAESRVEETFWDQF